MNRIIPKKYLPALLMIFILGIGVRFINFRESLYFGYDEARDAYLSQEIYLKGDLKLIGPQASAFAGIHHGPVYYYLIGPLFILGKGDPYFVSVVFRLINASGIIGIFLVGSLLFTPFVGLISAFIYAISYEQFIYAIFTGNPSISNVSWTLMFVGIGLVYSLKNKKTIGLVVMFLGATIIPQFDLIIGFSIFVLIGALYLMRKNLISVTLKQWIIVLVIGLSPLYSYVLSELKNNFIAFKTVLGIIKSNTSIVREGESGLTIFVNNFTGLFRNNIIDLSLSGGLITLLLLGILIFLIIKGKENNKYFLIILWILSFSLLIFARGFMPLYSYAGVGIGLIVGTSIVLNTIGNKNKVAMLVIISLIAFSNLTKIIKQSRESLVVEIKAQPGMKLLDEITIINKTYEYSKNQAFTIRTTTMPYKIQTVWAYLYEEYGQKNYGYLPYNEGGDIEGFPGSLPPPVKGTTCNRFLIVEPTRGIPDNLVEQDRVEEDLFSEVIKEEKIGSFILEHRIAKDKNCHDIMPQSVLN